MVRVGEADFALPVARVREVLPVPQLTPLPLTADAVRGVASVRGEVVAVLDLARRFSGEAASEGSERRLVMVSDAGNEEVIALLVDAVVGLVDPDSSGAVDVPREVTDGLPEGVAAGAWRGADRLVTLLDVDRVLDI